MASQTDVLVRAGIQQGSIYNFSPKTGVPNHYYIVLNRDPKNGDAIHLAPFTTKKIKVLQFINSRKLDPQTFVDLLAGECPFLPSKVDSGVDCNRLLSPTIDELVALIDVSNGTATYPVADVSLVARVVSGVMVSRMVSPAIKNTL